MPPRVGGIISIKYLMDKITNNPYSTNQNLKKTNVATEQSKSGVAVAEKTEDKVVKKVTEDVKVELSEKSKELKKTLDIATKSLKLTDKPGIYFMSGFDWWGAGSIKGNYDGIRDMANTVKGAKHFPWDEQDKVLEEIKKIKPDKPLILVGHSFGGDGVFEIAQRLNTLENGFRKVDLMVTLDSVGFDNDKVPQNVKKNVNYIANGPYQFLNDGPNIALDYNRSKVENYLRTEAHAELDDLTDVQMHILEEIDKALG